MHWNASGITTGEIVLAGNAMHIRTPVRRILDGSQAYRRRTRNALAPPPSSHGPSAAGQRVLRPSIGRPSQMVW